MTPRSLAGKLKHHRCKIKNFHYHHHRHQKKQLGELKVPLFKNLVTLESNSYHPHPYMDSVSWLYLDPNPLIKIEAPLTEKHDIDYAMPPPRRKTNCSNYKCYNHRHHYHHQRRHQHCRHRRVVSDPGAKNWNTNNPLELKSHRRVSSYHHEDDICLQEAFNDRNRDDSITSTFRKVPWHPNLHMLKIRPT